MMAIRNTKAELISDLQAQIQNANTVSNRISSLEMYDILQSIVGLLLVGSTDAATPAGIIPANRLPAASATAQGAMSSTDFQKLASIAFGAGAQSGVEIVGLLTALSESQKLGFPAMQGEIAIDQIPIGITRDTELADLFKNVSLSGQVLTFTQHNDSTIPITLPSGGVNDGVIDGLSYTPSTRLMTVSRSIGADITLTIPEVTTSEAGLMPSADKTKLDGIESGATADQTGGEIVSLIEGEAGNDRLQMSAVRGEVPEAQIPSAIARVTSLADLFKNVSLSGNIITFTQNDDTTIAVTLPSGDGVITDITYAPATRVITVSRSVGDDLTLTLPEVTTSAAGLMPSADKTKLDAIESGATADQTGVEIITAIEGETGTDRLEMSAVQGEVPEAQIPSTITRNTNLADLFKNVSLSGNVLTFTQYDDTTITITLPTTGGGGSDDGVISGVSYAPATRIVTITRTVGNDLTVTLPEATTTAAGMMSGADKTRLDGIEDNATADQTGAEIVSEVGANRFLPTPLGSAGQIPKVNSGGSAVEWRDDATGSGGTLSGALSQLLEYEPATGVALAANEGTEIAQDFALAESDRGSILLFTFAVATTSGSTTSADRAPTSAPLWIPVDDWLDRPVTPVGTNTDSRGSEAWTSPAFNANAGASESSWLRFLVGRRAGSATGQSRVAVVATSSAALTYLKVEILRLSGSTPAAPSTHQRYASFKTTAPFVATDFTSPPGVGNTTGDFTLSGAPSGQYYVAFWSAEQVTSITTPLSFSPTQNRIGSFTESRLTIGATNGYLYTSNLGSYLAAGVNTRWVLG